MHDGIHIALKAEQLGTLWGVPITNTLVMSFIVVFVITTVAFLVTRNLSLIPSRGQVALEFLVGGIFDYMKETLESEKLARITFPLIASIFLFIFTANMMEFIPGVGSLVVHHGEESIPLLRSLNTDLNATLAIAIVAFLAIEIAGVAVLGFLKYGSKFVTFKSPLAFAIGIIDLIGEVARLISFSFRLFGNIFAGEVMLLVIAFFVPVFLPVPLMLFEVMVGVIQAAIFALLTLFFIKIAVSEPH